MAIKEAGIFAKWRKEVDKLGYVDLCEKEKRLYEWNGTGNKNLLYEFCAMNGHLAAFEEVFER